jgi:hypothetical protein
MNKFKSILMAGVLLAGVVSNQVMADNTQLVYHTLATAGSVAIARLTGGGLRNADALAVEKTTAGYAGYGVGAVANGLLAEKVESDFNKDREASVKKSKRDEGLTLAEHTLGLIVYTVGYLISLKVFPPAK